MLDEPLAPGDARRLIRAIVTTGAVRFGSHALDEMAKDGLTDAEVLHVLRSGVVRAGEWERGSWRHRVDAGLVTVVVAFVSEATLRIVTAWRRER